MEKCDVAILIFEIIVNYLTAYVKTYLIAVLYGIAYRSLNICDKNLVSRNLLFHNAKRKVLLLPII